MHSNNLAATTTLVVLAPVAAEYSSGYLPSTGHPLALVGGLVVFAPLYGGAALLVREVAVRTGHGWAGVLLLAALFGLVEATVIDLSLFTSERDDISSWSSIVGPTMVDRLGVSAGAAVTWIGGYVVLSIAVPIAVTEALFPRQRGRSWVSGPAIAVVTAAFLAIAVLVHVHEQRAYGASLTPARVLVVALLSATLLGAALAPRTRPPARRTGRLPRAWLLVLVGAVVTFGVDCATAGWGWTVAALLVAGGAAGWLLHLGRRASFAGRGAALLAVGALAERALLAFSAPVPDQVTAAAKYAHNAAFLAVVLGLGVLTLVRARTAP